MNYYFPRTVAIEEDDADEFAGAGDIEAVEGELNHSFLLTLLSEDQRWVAALL